MTIPSVGSGLPPSSDPPPPPGGNGEKLPNCFRSTVSCSNSVILELIAAIVLFLFAIIGFVLGTMCLVNPSSKNICGNTGDMGVFYGVLYVMVAIGALLPQCVTNPLVDGVWCLLKPRNREGNEVDRSGSNNRLSRVPACLQDGSCSRLVNLRGRIFSYFSQHSILQMGLTIVLGIFLLAYGIASIATGSICLHAKRSSSSANSSTGNSINSQSNVCGPVSVMDIFSGIMGIIMGIGLLLSGYSDNSAAQAAETAAVVEVGEALPMLDDSPPPVDGESPGDQPPPVGGDSNDGRDSPLHE